MHLPRHREETSPAKNCQRTHEPSRNQPRRNLIRDDTSLPPTPSNIILLAPTQIPMQRSLLTCQRLLNSCDIYFGINPNNKPIYEGEEETKESEVNEEATTPRQTNTERTINRKVSFNSITANTSNLQPNPKPLQIRPAWTHKCHPTHTSTFPQPKTTLPLPNQTHYLLNNNLSIHPLTNSNVQHPSPPTHHTHSQPTHPHNQTSLYSKPYKVSQKIRAASLDKWNVL